MDSRPDSESNIEPPAPEVLKDQADGETAINKPAVAATRPKAGLRWRRGSYRPSHKATFIGIAVVVMILAVNAAVIVFFMRSQTQDNSKSNQAEVTISSSVLDSLGVSRTATSSSDTELVVNPKSTFKNEVTIGGDVSVGGQTNLNGKLVGTDASLTKLDAGSTSVSQLNVNGDATVSNLNTREDLTVAGLTRLQGAVTVSQLLTVNNSMNVSGNLSVGGTFSIGSLQITNLTIGGHLITRGSAPGVSAGSAVGSYGTVSISGNDVSGTVAVNAGVGAGNGILVYVTFVNQYGSTPHVVITPIGRSAGSIYVNRTSSGFNIGVSNALSPAGYAFDYIVMQ